MVKIPATRINDVWMGSNCLATQFSRLYNLSIDKGFFSGQYGLIFLRFERRTFQEKEISLFNSIFDLPSKVILTNEVGAT